MIQAWEINFILWFQNIGDWLTPIMKFFTLLGYPLPYLVFIMLIYWCIDRRLGIRIAIFVLLSASVNEILKQAIHAPRPYWLNSRVQPLYHALTSFGMPSGHAQQAMAWVVVGAYLKEKWFWIVTIVFPFMIGISRAYLGVHFPTQIVAGWLIGGIMIIGFLRLENPVIRWIQTKTIHQQFFVVFSVSLILLVIGGICVSLLINWQIPVEWVQNVSVYLAENKTLAPVSFEVIAISTGGLLGFTLGAIFISHFGGFDTGGSWRKRALRFVFGVICTSGIGAVLIAVAKVFSLDKEQGILYHGWQFVGAFSICLSIMFLMPLLFVRLKLAEPFDRLRANGGLFQQI
jgi:membrane-associated phospholipid phosphatase